MWRSYLKTSWRTLWKNKEYAVINILGLTIGLAATLMISLLIKFEFSYERWLPNSDLIYRISGASRHPSGEWYYNPQLQAFLKPVLDEAVPEFQELTRTRANRFVVSSGPHTFFENVTEVDRNFFAIFDLPMSQGSSALTDVSTVLISENTAYKYFGDTNPVGQSLVINTDRLLKVGGVFQDLPRNTHLELHLITGFVDISQLEEQHGVPTVSIYGRTAPGVNLDFFDTLQTEIVESHFGGLAPAGTSVSDSMRLMAVPLLDLHLHSKTRDSVVSQITWMYAFSLTGMLLLAVVCTNFINLNGARSVARIREIRIREAVGASRRDLMIQLLGETLLMVLLAFWLAIFLVELVRPWLAGWLSSAARSA